MSKPTNDILKVVSTGVNLILDFKPSTDCLKIVEAANKSGSFITFKGRKPTIDLLKIAMAAQGNVTFDLTRD